DVGADEQREDAGEVLECAQAVAMLVAPGLNDVRLVLEAHQVQQHHSSSPSMSSSGTSTTTLWMSIRNQSRNVARSRVDGHADSSSVHAASCTSKMNAAFSSTQSRTSSSSSNSGSRNAAPYGLARRTVSAPLSASASVRRVHATYGSAPVTETAVRFTTRIASVYS